MLMNLQPGSYNAADNADNLHEQLIASYQNLAEQAASTKGRIDYIVDQAQLDQAAYPQVNGALNALYNLQTYSEDGSHDEQAAQQAVEDLRQHLGGSTEEITTWMTLYADVNRQIRKATPVVQRWWGESRQRASAGIDWGAYFANLLENKQLQDEGAGHVLNIIALLDPATDPPANFSRLISDTQRAENLYAIFEMSELTRPAERAADKEEPVRARILEDELHQLQDRNLEASEMISRDRHKYLLDKGAAYYSNIDQLQALAEQLADSGISLPVTIYQALRGHSGQAIEALDELDRMHVMEGWKRSRPATLSDYELLEKPLGQDGLRWLKSKLSAVPAMLVAGLKRIDVVQNMQSVEPAYDQACSTFGVYDSDTSTIVLNSGGDMFDIVNEGAPEYIDEWHARLDARLTINLYHFIAHSAISRSIPLAWIREYIRLLRDNDTPSTELSQRARQTRLRDNADMEAMCEDIAFLLYKPAALENGISERYKLLSQLRPSNRKSAAKNTDK